MAEEKFELPKLSAEEIRALRERMDQKVDSRALAADFMAGRTARRNEWCAEIERRFGFDPRLTVTELESFDAGDGNNMADEPEVHALRRVPLSMWTPSDTALMLGYGHGERFGIWLAIDVLSEDPMIEAAHYPGDLLDAAARTMAAEPPPDAPDGTSALAVFAEIVEKARAAIWRGFEEKAIRLGLDAETRETERVRIEAGWAPDDEPEPFWEVGFDLDHWALARERLWPAEKLAVADREMVYARYRPDFGLEMVPARVLADPAVQALLDGPDTFWFRRETHFEIVVAPDGGGVRLRRLSESAIENWHGIAFSGADAAKAWVGKEYGLDPSVWRES